MLVILVHVNAKLPEVDLGQLNLLHQLLVRRGNIVEGKDAPAETEEEECAERNEGPEGELYGQGGSKVSRMILTIGYGDGLKNGRGG
jgi:hypothetical protein